MYQVFRVHRGHNLHVIHETRTGHNRTNNVYVLCRHEPMAGERDKGPSTCPTCLELDNPCDLSRAEVNYFTRLIAGDPSIQYGQDSNARAKLITRDLITKDDELTRRGKVLALDWTLRPAPAPSIRGVVHARTPLSKYPVCDRTGVLDGFDKMSNDKYERLRKADYPVTCIACLKV